MFHTKRRGAQPGEYTIELSVEADNCPAKFTKNYRFTLFESDTAELKSHAEDYKFGGGISYEMDKHVGVFVPISQ